MKAATARRSLGQLGTRLTTTTPGRWRWEIIPEPMLADVRKDQKEKAETFVAKMLAASMKELGS